MSTSPDDVRTREPHRLLAIYLNDHLGGSAAGLALVRRCRRSNAGTPLDRVLIDVEAEIEADQRTLEALMVRLGIGRNRVKRTLGSIAEFAARLKGNGRLVRYSPLSRVVELEGLAAGIVTKRSLWRSLRAIADRHPALDAAALDILVARATSQYDRVIAEHDRAAEIAFPAHDPGESASSSVEAAWQ